jgi:hypothetical protein
MLFEFVVVWDEMEVVEEERTMEQDVIAASCVYKQLVAR